MQQILVDMKADEIERLSNRTSMYSQQHLTDENGRKCTYKVNSIDQEEST